jgi:dipeptidyl aminopeptidase/acylaminoacyl peptidase
VDGGAPRKLTAEGTINERPRWSPDAKRIAFISNRGGSSQVWTMEADGSKQQQMTTLSTEASGVTWTGDGRRLLFISEVFPECADEACNQKKLDAEKNSKVKARMYTSLLYRHWNEWRGPRRRHLMALPAEGGVPKDLMPGNPHDVPPFSLGGPEDYVSSPDGAEICFSMHPEEQQAVSTNWDLFVVPAAGGEMKKITLNPAADASPLYSPDGKYLAYRSQSKPGYESDRWRLNVMDRATGVATSLTESIDRSVQSMTWAPDSKRIFYTIEDRGRQTLHVVPITGGGSRQIIGASSHVDDVQFSPDGRTMIYSEHSGSKPVEFYRVSSAGGSAVPLARANDELLGSYQLTPLEEFSVDSERARIQSFVVKPPQFNPATKYPVLFLIHGGPQGAWGESWSYRWNPQVFASAGFVVVMPNPRGSTGYGQQFTDDINQDWGGKVYNDILATADYVAKQSWADTDRFSAAGGSYGGYMVNWLLGHSDRFKAFVSHAGVFDLKSMALETEELWFTKWEFGGMPWETPDVHDKWSPSNFVPNFKTPTLVVHGELDYRVPVGQGLQLFTALQTQKVPSKLLLFPDEGHWILKPHNSMLWYNSLIEWLREFAAPKPVAAP